MSIQTTTCESIFSHDILVKFGPNYTCLFSNDWKMLIVTLGYGFTIQNETVLLNSLNLIGRAEECGYFQTSLMVNIAYSANLPVPSAYIYAPSVVYYECQNLTVVGTQSYAGLLGLLYQWNITLPQNNYFFDLGINSAINIDRSLLSPGIITVNLLVQNKFGINNSQTITISSESTNLI